MSKFNTICMQIIGEEAASFGTVKPTMPKDVSELRSGIDGVKLLNQDLTYEFEVEYEGVMYIVKAKTNIAGKIIDWDVYLADNPSKHASTDVQHHVANKLVEVWYSVLDIK